MHVMYVCMYNLNIHLCSIDFHYHLVNPNPVGVGGKEVPGLPKPTL